MAYICGLTTEKERKILLHRGWDIEKCPAELIPLDDNINPDDFVMVWVDSSLFEVMSGPDWDKFLSELNEN